MKRTISLLSIIALLLISSGNLFAQQDVIATATVEQEITLTKNNDVAFGTIQQNSSPVLDPNGSNDQDVGGTTTYGDIDINASSNTSITVSWNTDATLSDGSATPNTMAFTADVDGRGDGTDDNSGASDVTNGSSVTTDSSGNFFLYIGGSLTVGASQTTGSYSTANSGGTALTITVNYQ